MFMDAIDLRDFYATSLGQAARRVLGHRIRALWPDVSGLNVLGLGYATPFLSPFRGEAERVLAAMPASQGVLPWPREDGGLTTLVDEGDLPFPDSSMDRILIVHGLESTEQLRPFMREAWRVLSESGRLLVVAPNRRGIWARLERTPFGHGQPFSTGQLSRVLRDTLFTPEQARGALYVPPTRWRMVLASALAWEEVGPRWFGTFAGVVMAEATKQIYAGTAEPAKRRRAYPALAQRDFGA
jgi:SAM-dependent methyltransferase